MSSWKANNIDTVLPQIEDELTAVNNVTLKIFDGEIYALAGESGCGKSTLAKAITKLVPITNGDIFYDNNSIKKQNKNKKIRM